MSQIFHVTNYSQWGCFFQRANIWVAAVTKQNVNASQVFEFLLKMLEVCIDALGRFPTTNIFVSVLHTIIIYISLYEFGLREIFCNTRLSECNCF